MLICTRVYINNSGSGWRNREGLEQTMWVSALHGQGTAESLGLPPCSQMTVWEKIWKGVIKPTGEACKAKWRTAPHLISSGGWFSLHTISSPCYPLWYSTAGVSGKGLLAFGCISLWKLLWPLFSFVGPAAILSLKRSVVTPFCLSWHV